MEALLILGLDFYATLNTCLSLAISKDEVVTPEHLQKALVAFELKVSLFLHTINVLSYIFVCKPKCQRNMAHAIATEEDFAIQYNDTVVCDVCREVRHSFMDELFYSFVISQCRKKVKKAMK